MSSISSIVHASQTKAKPLQKLDSAVQFRTLLANGVRRSSANFALRILPNGLGCARLGIIAAKKVAKRAVDRNRAKRLVRELLRLRARAALPAVALGEVDIVVLIRNDLRGMQSEPLRQELAGLLDKVSSAAVRSTIESPGIGLEIK